MREEPLIAGVDEVGRGALFGPVVAAVVVTSPSFFSQLWELGVKDSKQLSPQKRQKLSQQIQKDFVCRIGYATVEEIDRLNIFQASLLAMARAIRKLPVSPCLCLIDGKHTIKDLSIPQEAVIKGDQRSPLIAAASIVAKVWRDDLITRWERRYPDYALARHKGYGTAQHQQAIRNYGVTSQHRLSFSPCQRSQEAVGRRQEGS
jgi:ribonuclease HII